MPKDCKFSIRDVVKLKGHSTLWELVCHRGGDFYTIKGSGEILIVHRSRLTLIKSPSKEA